MSVTAAARRQTAPASTSAGGMLHEGSKGPEVLALQKALAAAGFNPHGFDGSFGPKTKAALIAFQRAAGITVDGRAGPQTWGALKGKVAVTPAPSPAPAPLRKGDMGPDVQKLQTQLEQHGVHTGGADGKFGPMTQRAVIEFQRGQGLNANGVVGPETWAALAKPGSPSGPVTGPATGPSTGPVTGPEAPASEKIQSMLGWAKSMLGTPYAAVNPFRFGDVPWDGAAHKSVNGSSTVWQYPKGTRVFDCSGFVVAAYRQLGVDLAARGLASTATFNADTKFLKPLTREQLAPGDLIMYQPKNGIGHVVIYMGEGKAIEAAGGKGVSINNVDWDRIKSMRRVPVP
jgi:peptidoglycan hydrolase-like protein with peptidoglycan-binding domain